MTMRHSSTSQGDHTPAPRGYLAWHEWAERMSKTHRQRRCGGCGLFKVWTPRATQGRTEET